ncbi:mechanosensitive ion channel family protein, partial [Komagataeibacter pomaceti]|nr:mechanosensitive ion channel family protein [Novacetimonas pomaceti]
MVIEKQIHPILEQVDGLLPPILGYASQVFLALIVLFVVGKLGNVVALAMGRMMDVGHIEPTLRGFLVSVVGLFLKAR